MELLDFATHIVVDAVTGEIWRKPDITENVIAWGAALRALSRLTPAFEETRQYTKQEILSSHPYFKIDKDDSSYPLKEYQNNQLVMLKSVSFKIIPGNFKITMASTRLSIPTTATTATATVYYINSETSAIGTVEIGKYPLLYNAMSALKNKWYIDIPSQDLFNKIGESVNNTLQFSIIESYNMLNSPHYNVGSCSADYYNTLIGGDDVTLPELTIKPIEPNIPIV